MPSNPLEHQRFSALLTRVEHRALRAEAARRGVSMASLFRKFFHSQLQVIVKSEARRNRHAR